MPQLGAEGGPFRRRHTTGGGPHGTSHPPGVDLHEEGGSMRKAVLRTVLAEHLAVLHRRETELERILAGDSRLFAAGAGPERFQEDLDRVRLVIRGFDELLPKAWELEPGLAAPARGEPGRGGEGARAGAGDGGRDRADAAAAGPRAPARGRRPAAGRDGALPLPPRPARRDRDGRVRARRGPAGGHLPDRRASRAPPGSPAAASASSGWRLRGAEHAVGEGAEPLLEPLDAALHDLLRRAAASARPGERCG